MLDNVRGAAEAAESGSDAEKEALTMVDNMTQIFNDMAER
jgi:hypothetical protein